jgi:glycosyltransferase involved in cell wall biosynthesis
MAYPKVLIVTGYFNREWCVKESMLSLINQTYENIQIIAFDDCSTDNTYPLLQELNSDKFTALRLPKNMGFVNGLIFVLNQHASNYDYIAIHGSGDISLLDRIAKQVEAFQHDNSLAIVSCKIANVDQQNATRKEQSLNEYYTLSEILKKNPFSHGEVMFKRDLYQKVGGYRSIFHFSQDYDLWLRLLSFGKARVIQQVLYERQIQFDGVSYNPKKIVRQEMFAHLAQHLNQLDSKKQQEIVNGMMNGTSIFEIIDFRLSSIQKNLFIRYNVLIAKNQNVETRVFIEHSTSLYKIYYRAMHVVTKIPAFRILINQAYRIVMKMKVLKRKLYA